MPGGVAVMRPVVALSVIAVSEVLAEVLLVLEGEPAVEGDLQQQHGTKR